MPPFYPLLTSQQSALCLEIVAQHGAVFIRRRARQEGGAKQVEKFGSTPRYCANPFPAGNQSSPHLRLAPDPLPDDALRAR
jgi:hypothetical protein